MRKTEIEANETSQVRKNERVNRIINSTIVKNRGMRSISRNCKGERTAKRQPQSTRLEGLCRRVSLSLNIAKNWDRKVQLDL